MAEEKKAEDYVREEKSKISEQLKKDPYSYICNWAESLYLKIGSYCFEIFSLVPCSLIINDFDYFSEKKRSNINVFLLTESGGAKCLDEDSLVQMIDGTEKRIKELKRGDEVLSLDENDLKIKKKKVEEIIDNGRKIVYELITTSGRIINLTENHPLYTFDGWKKLNNLKIGDLIACPRTLGQVNKKRSPLRDCEIKILGYLLSDGYISTKKISFTNEKEKILSDFEISIKEFSKNLKVRRYNKKNNKAKSLQVSSINYESVLEDGEIKGIHRRRKNDLVRWIDNIGLLDLNSYNKFIPKEIMESENKQVALFLNRMFACDGSINYENRGNKIRFCIDYASNSKRMINQIRNLLLRFNIQSRIRKTKNKLNGKIFKSFRLSIRDIENCKRFIKEIRLVIGKERESIKILNTKSINSNTNTDIIPYKIKKEIKKYKKQNNLEWKDILKKGWKRAHCFDGSNSKKNISRTSLNLFDTPISKKYADSDIFWDKVKSIKKVGIKNIFDLSIKNSHNFIANNIFVHNSSLLRLFAKLTYYPIEGRSYTSAELEDVVFEKEIFSLIIEDYSTMAMDERVNKIIEGIIGDEKIIDRHTKRKSIRKNVEAVGIFAGVPGDITDRLTRGKMSRTIILVKIYDDEEHSSVGKYIAENIGITGNGNMDKFEEIKEYYSLLQKIQSNETNLPYIESFDINQKIRDRIVMEWDNLTKGIRKRGIKFNFQRELEDGFRILISHSFLNYFNREKIKNILIVEEQDCDVAIKIMKRSLMTKYNIYRSEKLASGIRSVAKFHEIMGNKELPEQIKQLIPVHLKKKGLK